jgi:hypothetical protein
MNYQQIVVQFSAEARVFSSYYSSSSQRLRLAVETTQPPTEWVLRVLPPGVKWTGREADPSPHSSV